MQTTGMPKLSLGYMQHNPSPGRGPTFLLMIFCFSFNAYTSELTSFIEAKKCFKNNEFHRALKKIDLYLQVKPQDIDAKAFRAETLHILGEHTKALKLYQHILKLRPNWEHIQTQYIHLLIDLGALIPAQILIDQYNLSNTRMKGDLAIQYFRWNDFDISEKILLNNSNSPHNNLKKRSKLDLLMLYRKKSLWNNFLQEYKSIQDKYQTLPKWILQANADALLNDKKPHAAIRIYREIEKQYNLSSNQYPQSYNLQMSIFSCYIEMEMFEEAFELLEKTRPHIPGITKQRGIVTNNYHWVDIRLNYVWWYMYQNRLDEASSLLQDLSQLMPANEMVEFVKAYLCLWRGHPSDAYERFSIIKHGNHINSIQTENGINIALDNLGYKEKARQNTEKILHQYPQSTLLSKQKENFMIDDMNIFKFETSLEDYYKLSISSPINLMNREHGGDRIFLEHSWWKKGNDYYNARSDSKLSLEQSQDRSYEKIGWRGNYVPGIKGELYLSYFNHETVGFGAHADAGTDRWFLSLGYDSLSNKVPLINGLEGNETYTQIMYRHDETFDLAFKVEHIAQNDGNHRSSYLVKSHMLIKNYHRWQFNMDTELIYVDRKKDQNDLYYSPNDYLQAYLIPSVSHLWYRKYDYSFSDTLFVGMGYKDERNYEAGNVSFIRYQQELKVNKKLRFLWSLSWNEDIFYGEQEDDFGGFFEMEWRF